MFFDLNADPVATVPSSAEPDPASKIDADADSQPC